MKSITPVLLSMLLLSSPSLADERQTLFEGFDAKIVSIVDEMTDEESGVIFLDFGPIYMAVYGHNDFAIWASADDLNFAFDATHLIRVGDNKPYPLKSLDKRNGLRPTSAVEAESVVRSLAKGEEVKLRYYDWPRYDKSDRKLQNPNFGFVYLKAVELLGWTDLGIPFKLAPVDLNIHIPEDPEYRGSARLYVIGNPDLGLKKGFDKYGGGCYVTVGINELFGIQNGKWCCSKVEIYGNNRIIIRDSEGKVVFEDKVPNDYNIQRNQGNPWPSGSRAAKAAWDCAPLGSIEIEDTLYGKRVVLYGFRELWEWGVAHAGLPSFE